MITWVPFRLMWWTEFLQRFANWDAVISVQWDGASDMRTLVVTADNRVYEVPGDNRVCVVAPDSRVMVA